MTLLNIFNCLVKAWKDKVEALVREIPEVLGEDPEEERHRDFAIEKVRDAIADRWVAVRNIAAHSHASQYEELVQATKTILAPLVSAYGAEIHFAPFADVGRPLPSPPDAHAGEIEGVPHGDNDEGETTSSQVSSVSLVPHEFRYLTTKAGVWTCLVVP